MTGVYRIIINGKSYVGSSYDIERRIKMHYAKLEKQKHNNSEMQKEYNKTKDFYSELLRECNIDTLRHWEVYYIGKCDSFENGFNNAITQIEQTHKLRIFEYEKNIIKRNFYVKSSKLRNILNCSYDDMEHLLKLGLPYEKRNRGYRYYNVNEVIKFLQRNDLLEDDVLILEATNE